MTESAALSLPFDHYERYRLTAWVASLLWESEDSKRAILDVGGHFGTLKLFLPDHRVVVADPKPPPTYAYREAVPFRSDAYLRAEGGRLPFRDGSFNLVCAHDTLEHVPEAGRERFLADITRVTSGFLILNGPVSTPEAGAAERRIARMWTSALGASDHALEEHLRYGLPERESVQDALRALGMAFVAVPNGNVFVWQAMMALKSYLQGLPDSEAAHEALDRLFNADLALADFGGPCYRTAFVAARDPQDGPALERVREAFAVRTTGPPPLSSRELVDELVDALGAHVVRLRGIIAELRSDVDSVNEEARRNAARVEELNVIVRELEARLSRGA